jgi:hypothetical protein
MSIGCPFDVVLMSLDVLWMSFGCALDVLGSLGKIFKCSTPPLELYGVAVNLHRSPFHDHGSFELDEFYGITERASSNDSKSGWSATRSLSIPHRWLNRGQSLFHGTY